MFYLLYLYFGDAAKDYPLLNLVQYQTVRVALAMATAMIVAVMIAQTFDPAAEMASTSAVATLRVRPARTTFPRATSLSPAAGASRLILNSAVSTAVPRSISDSAA